MRILHRLCLCLLPLAGFIYPSVTSGQNGITVINGTRISQRFIISLYTSDATGTNCTTWSSNYSWSSPVPPGGSVGFGLASSSKIVAVYAESSAVSCCTHAPETAWHYGNYYYTADCTGTTPHNYCCVYCFTWTNTSTAYAQPQVFLIDGTNNIVQPAWEAIAASPGGYVNRCFTNCYGSSPPPGGCGVGLIGDAREGSRVPDQTVNGTQYDFGNGGGNGSGGEQGPGPIVNNQSTNAPGNKAGGTTNLASQADIFRLGDVLVNALTHINDSVMRADTNIVATHTDLSTGLATINTNLNGLRGAVGSLSNLLSGTTNLWSIRTNLMEGLARIGTNTAINATNAAEIAGILEGLTNGITAGISNALWYTNMPLYSLLSNHLAVITTNLDTLNNLRDGLSGTIQHLSALGSGTAPDSTFAVLQLKDRFGNPLPGVLGRPIDFKESLSLQKLEEKATGFRTWFRIISLWFLTALTLTYYAAELRLALFQALAIPAAPGAGNVKLLTGIGALAGPVGAGTGAAAGLTLKLTTGIIILTGLIFAPALIVNLIETISYLWPSTADFGNATASALPGATTQIIYLFSQWFAIVPAMILGVNTAVAMLGLDATVSLCLVYLKIAEE